jgi:hypothetical protein
MSYIGDDNAFMNTELIATVKSFTVQNPWIKVIKQPGPRAKNFLWV